MSMLYLPNVWVPANSWNELRTFVVYGVRWCIRRSLATLQSPLIKPRDIVGKSPAEIDKFARRLGLLPRGPSPHRGFGAYVDPYTGEQRILIHTGLDIGHHFHVNNEYGKRLDINGKVVDPESPEAHLPLGRE